MMIRPIQKDDVLALVGHSYGQSMRGLAVELDGKPIAIAGVLHTTPLQCFSVMTDIMRSSPKTIVRAGVMMRDIMDSYSSTIYAMADENEPTSERFLQRIGFQNVTGRLYKWQQQSQSS